MAMAFRQKVSLSANDAVHLACACIAGANVLLTCDDDLRRLAPQVAPDLTALNPVEYVRRMEGAG
jgi:predicted nucleic acid-binding protein